MILAREYYTAEIPQRRLIIKLPRQPGHSPKNTLGLRPQKNRPHKTGPLILSGGRPTQIVRPLPTGPEAGRNTSEEEREEGEATSEDEDQPRYLIRTIPARRGGATKRTGIQKAVDFSNEAILLTKFAAANNKVAIEETTRAIEYTCNISDNTGTTQQAREQTRVAAKATRVAKKSSRKAGKAIERALRRITQLNESELRHEQETREQSITESRTSGSGVRIGEDNGP